MSCSFSIYTVDLFEIFTLLFPEAIDQEEQETLEQGEDLISSEETTSKPQKDTKREGKTQQVTVKHVQIAVPVPSEGWKHPAFGPTQPGLCNSGPCRLGHKQHLPACKHTQHA